MHQEVGFGIRQLVDIAERALSPGINDPTTAVEVIHELHRVGRHLVQRSGARRGMTRAHSGSVSHPLRRVVGGPPDHPTDKERLA